MFDHCAEHDPLLLDQGHRDLQQLTPALREGLPESALPLAVAVIDARSRQRFRRAHSLF